MEQSSKCESFPINGCAEKCISQKTYTFKVPFLPGFGLAYFLMALFVLSLRNKPDEKTK